MKEELIEFETAKKAKQKGFKPKREWNPEYVPGYIEDEETQNHELTEIQEEDWDRGNYYLAPTQTLLQKWLRTEHQMHIVIQVGLGELIWWSFQIIDIKTNELILDYDGSHSTYEQSLEAALFEALGYIK